MTPGFKSAVRNCKDALENWVKAVDTSWRSSGGKKIDLCSRQLEDVAEEVDGPLYSMLISSEAKDPAAQRLFDTLQTMVAMAQAHVDDQKETLKAAAGDIRGLVRQMREIYESRSMQVARSVIAEEFARLNEDDGDPQVNASDPTKLSHDSLDSTIDSYLVKYAKTQETAGEPIEPNTNPKPGTEESKVSASDFAGDVANLIERSNKLIDVEGTILRRAINYATENFGPEKSQEIQDVLNNDFGLSPMSDRDVEAQIDGDVSAAKGAGPELGGAA